MMISTPLAARRMGMAASQLLYSLGIHNLYFPRDVVPAVEFDRLRLKAVLSNMNNITVELAGSVSSNTFSRSYARSSADFSFSFQPLMVKSTTSG